MHINLKSLLAASMAMMATGAFAQYLPALVVEEATGEWCGWCPRGIVAMETMREAHPDGTFIGIAVHTRDEFELPSYFNYMGISGFPRANFSRTYNNQGIDPTQCRYYYNMLRAGEVEGKIDLSASLSADGSTISVSTVSTFGSDKNRTYKVAIVLTEDGVVGQYQNNSYAGGGSGAMGGFENMPSMIYEYVFNDVARLIYPSYDGATIATSVTDGTVIEKNFAVPMPSTVLKAENVNVIALLLADGKIINAVSRSLIDSNPGVPLCASFEASPSLRYAYRGVGVTASLLNLAEDAITFYTRYKLDGAKGTHYTDPQLRSIELGGELAIDELAAFASAGTGLYDLALEVSVDGVNFQPLALVDGITLKRLPEENKLSLVSFSVNKGSDGRVPANDVRIYTTVKSDCDVFSKPVTFTIYPQDYNTTSNYIYKDFKTVLFEGEHTFEISLNMVNSAYIGEPFVVTMMYPGDDGKPKYVYAEKTFVLGPASSAPVADARQPQTLVWDFPYERLSVGEEVALDAQASSGLEVRFVAAEGAHLASISGGKLRAEHDGVLVLAAMQTGNSDYLPAVPVIRTITIGSGYDSCADALAEGLERNGSVLNYAGSANVEIYAADGRLMLKAQGPCSYTLPARGLYIVKAGSKACKIAY